MQIVNGKLHPRGNEVSRARSWARTLFKDNEQGWGPSLNGTKASGFEKPSIEGRDWMTGRCTALLSGCGPVL